MKRSLIITIATCLWACLVSGQHFLNLDLEHIDDENGLPRGWYVTEESGCRIETDSSFSRSGKNSLRIAPTTDADGSVAIVFPIESNALPAPKGELTFSFYIRSKKRPDNILVAIRQLNTSRQPFQEKQASELSRAGRSWYRLETITTTNEEILAVALELKANIRDTVWIDKLEINAGGTEIVDGQPPIPHIPLAGEINWLNENVTPIRPPNESEKNAELAGLKRTFDDYSLVALGEVTHGSHEIYELKDQLVRFLFEEMNFSILAMEMDMADAEKLNQYVFYNVGDPQSLLENTQLWPWRTEEFLSTLRWANAFNKNSQRKISIVGIDPVSSHLSDSVCQFARQYNELLYQKVDSVHYLINHNFHLSLNSQKRNILLDAVDDLLEFWNDQKRFADEAPLTTAQWQWLERNFLALEQFILIHSAANNNADSLRNASMAENTKSILRLNPDAKVILWAHNDHIKKTGDALGSYLDQTDGYYALGFALGSGTFMGIRMVDGYTPELGKCSLIPPVSDSYELYFSKSMHPVSFLNFTDLKRTDSNNWLFEKHRFRFVGAVESRRYQYSYRHLTEDFDGLIFIRNSTSSRPLHTSK